MRVCLINPPCNLKQPYHIDGFTPSIPLGLAYIASVLEQHTHEVVVIDAPAEGRTSKVSSNGICTIGLSYDAIKQRIAQVQPDIVGIACAFSSRFANALKVAKIAKEVDASIKTMMGGIHSTLRPKEALRHSSVDFVVRGEGEESTEELVRKIEKGNDNFASIDGLGWKQENHIHVSPKTKFISDLDKIPYPARHLFPMKEYFKAERVTRWETGKYSVSNPQRNTIITSRGCPFTCAFCSIHATWGYKWRSRSPRNVVEEIKQVSENYGTDEISFEDDNLTLDRDRMTKICELMIKENIRVTWDTPNGVAIQTLDRQLLTTMKTSGCVTLKFGIESGDPSILGNVMHKPITLDKVRRVVRLCKEIGISTIGNFVIGMPGETRKSLLRTIKFSKTLPLDELNVAIATPYPETELYDICLKNGYIHKYNIKDYVADDSMETTAIIDTPYLKASEVQAFRQQFYEEFKGSRT